MAQKKQTQSNDAGKKCIDGLQCHYGLCANFKAGDQEKPTSGECSKYTSTFGCYHTINKGKSSSFICVD